MIMKLKYFILSSLAFVQFSHAQDSKAIKIHNDLSTALEQVDTDGEYLKLEKSSKLIEFITSKADEYILPEMLKSGEIPAGQAPGMPPMATETTKGCTGCNICVEVCPVGAIDEGLICDGESCIKCFACIKSCPEHARILVSPMIEEFSEKLSKMTVKMPELFL